MALHLALDPEYCRHFRDRVQQRYGLLLDRYVLKNAIDAMLQGYPSPDRVYVDNRVSPPVAHQEVWWIRFESKWVLAILDPRQEKLVTTLPPDAFPPPQVCQLNPKSHVLPRLAHSWVTPPKVVTPKPPPPEPSIMSSHTAKVLGLPKFPSQKGKP